MSDLRSLDCQDCGVTTLRRSPSQRYCSACSSARDKARKATWAKANPSPADPDRYPVQRSAMVEAGAATSRSSKAALHWNIDEYIDAHTFVRVAVPFDYAASKNAVWRYGRGGHVYARKEGNAFRENLTDRIRAVPAHWYQGKVWIDIFVEKPDHRGDATNVVDVVCDAVKDAIGVDDRWYSLARLDWAIVKESPRLIVGIRQEVGEDHQICSHCGRSLPLATSFGRNRSTSTGFTRVCRDCGAPKRGPRLREVA